MFEIQHFALSEAYQSRAKVSLKRSIKQLSAKVRGIRHEARTTFGVVEPKPMWTEGSAFGSGWKKYELKLEANRIGSGCIRPRHLALGLLRGVPYKAMEQKTHDNELDLARLRGAVQSVLGEAFQTDVSELYTLQSLKAWMDHEPAQSCCCAA